MTRRAFNPATGLHDGPVIGTVQEAGWHEVDQVDGLSMWQWQEDEKIRVVTGGDMDILRRIGAGLNFFSQLTNDEATWFLDRYLFGGLSGTPNDDIEYIVKRPSDT